MVVKDVDNVVNTSALTEWIYFSKDGYRACQHTWVEAAQKCVSAHAQTKIFADARKFCKDHGGDILCLGDWLGQFEAFRQWLKDNERSGGYPYYYHLGLVYDYYLQAEPSWRWVCDGSELQETVANFDMYSGPVTPVWTYMVYGYQWRVLFYPRDATPDYGAHQVTEQSLDFFCQM